MPHTETCPTCDGKTKIEETCLECGGRGMDVWSDCRECGGTGRIRRTCPGCKGKGYIVLRGNY